MNRKIIWGRRDHFRKWCCLNSNYLCVSEFICKVSIVKHNYKRPWNRCCMVVYLISSPDGCKQAETCLIALTPAAALRRGSAGCLCLAPFGKLFCFLGFGGKGNWISGYLLQQRFCWMEKTNKCECRSLSKEASVQIHLFGKTIDTRVFVAERNAVLKHFVAWMGCIPLVTLNGC